MKKKSFTLVEIMIVVAIIAILAAIAVPSLSKNRESAQKQTMAANVKLVDAAINGYLADNPSKVRSDVADWDTIRSYLKDQVATNYTVAGKKIKVDTTTVTYEDN